jgi:ABC-2 type transport system permease protein
MDTPTATRVARKYRLLLPYWAVFQTDLRQTMRNWVYLTWVIVVSLTAFGYVLYRMGAHRETGWVQQAADVMNDLLRWVVLGSVALIAALAVGSISAERGTLADSVLSRGISRYQYFLAKFHARLLSVLGTILLLGLVMLAGCYLMLSEEKLSLTGGLVALVVVAALLMVVVSCGVTLSALCGNTMLGMSLLWLFLYGGGYMLELLPASIPTPDRVLHEMPAILRGAYDSQMIWRLLEGTAILSGAVALLGMIGFSRRDV